METHVSINLLVRSLLVFILINMVFNRRGQYTVLLIINYLAIGYYTAEMDKRVSEETVTVTVTVRRT